MGAVLFAACVDGCSMDLVLQITMFTESIGDRSKSQYVVSLSAFLMKEDMTRKAIASQLLQKYSSQKATKSASISCKESAYVTSSSNYGNKKKKKKKNKDSNEIIWGYLNKKGSYRGESYKWKQAAANRKNHSRTEMVFVDENWMTPTRRWVQLFPRAKRSRTSWRPLSSPVRDSGANVQMVIDDLVLSMYKNPSKYSIETATAEVVKAKSEGTSKFISLRKRAGQARLRSTCYKDPSAPGFRPWSEQRLTHCFVHWTHLCFQDGREYCGCVQPYVWDVQCRWPESRERTSPRHRREGRQQFKRVECKTCLRKPSCHHVDGRQGCLHGYGHKSALCSAWFLPL